MSRRALLGLGVVVALYLVRYLWVFEIAWFKDDFLFLDLASRLSFLEAWSFQDAIGNAYRPLSRNVYFWIGQHLFGREATGYHIANLSLAIVGLALFFLVCRRLLAPGPESPGASAAASRPPRRPGSGRRRGRQRPDRRQERRPGRGEGGSGRCRAPGAPEGPALLAVLLFAVHPAAGTPSTWVCGIQDVLVVTLALAAVWAYLARRRVLYVVLFAAAVLSKEVAVFLPFILVAYDRLVRRDRWRRALRHQIVPLGLLALWALFNRWLPWNDLGVTIHTDEPGQISPLGRVDMGTVELTLRCLFMIEPIDAFSWAYGAPSTVLMGLLTVGAVLLAMRLPWPDRPPPRLWIVGAAWAFSGVLPVMAVESHFVYYAYYPALGLTLVAVWLMIRLRGRRGRVPRALTFGVAAVLAAALVIGAGYQHNPGQHDTHAIRRANHFLAGFKSDLETKDLPPDSRCFFWNVPSFIGFQLADGPALRVWLDRSDLEGHFLRDYGPDRTRPTFFFRHDGAGHLVEIFPGLEDPGLDRPAPFYAGAHAHLGYWLNRAGETEAAIVETRKALEVEPDHPEASANLGIFLVESRQFEAGAAALERGIGLNPEIAELRFYPGMAHAQLGRLDPAELRLLEFVRMAPDSPNHPVAVQLLARIRALRQQGDGGS